jgi:hypothetical protein
MTKRQISRLAQEAQKLGTIKSVTVVDDGDKYNITANIEGTPDEIASRVMNILRNVK